MITPKNVEVLNAYSYEKVMGRRERPIDMNLYKDRLKGKKILVAGVGSIGAELVKLLANCDVELHIIDISEIALCDIKDYLTPQGFKKFKLYLVDLKELQMFPKEILYGEFDYVINAAAYKHVIFCEDNKEMARKNNLGIANNLLHISAKEHLLISSDKAVHPSNYMGMTKRLCEFKYLAQPNTKIVRFGNVYGSSGSLIPRLLHCAKSGKVYLTDRNVTRYFMTIPEACFLIIDSLLNSQKKINILDMGDPIKVETIIKRFVDIYEKENTGKKLDIVEIGLFKGEKLHEELEYPKKLPLRVIQDLIAFHRLDEAKIQNIPYDVEE